MDDGWRRTGSTGFRPGFYNSLPLPPPSSPLIRNSGEEILLATRTWDPTTNKAAVKVPERNHVSARREEKTNCSSSFVRQKIHSACRVPASNCPEDFQVRGRAHPSAIRPPCDVRVKNPLNCRHVLRINGTEKRAKLKTGQGWQAGGHFVSRSAACICLDASWYSQVE